MKKKIEYPVPMVAMDGKIELDPIGSYTGRAEDPYEIPVQDADDLCKRPTLGLAFTIFLCISAWWPHRHGCAALAC